MNYQITPTDQIIIKKFSNFINQNKPQIPLFQREFIEERIEYFYKKILDYIIKNEAYSNKLLEHASSYKLLDNPITTIPFLNLIHCVNYENKCFIVDGQHRYYAYKKYYDNYKNDFNVVFAIKYCGTIQSVKEYFINLNNNFQLHDIILDENDIEKSASIKLYIKSKYGKHCSNSESPRYPNINLDQITKYFLDINKNLSSKSIIAKIDELNKDIEEELKINNIELYLLAHRKQKFYLGYIFIKTENEYKRKSFPKSLRHSLWRSIFQDNMNGFCSVCLCGVNIENFHAGHIISVKNGGSDNISNLRVVCSLCNLSMGTRNLDEFKNKYF